MSKKLSEPKKVKSKLIIRVPRPFGVTQLMNTVSKANITERAELFKNVQTLMIHHWVIGSGLLCGKSYSINELAAFLECEVSRIQVYMRDKILTTRIWEKERQEEIAEALLGQQLSWVLEDRMDVQSQVDLLKQSQGGKYTPFISSELNKALKLKIDSSTSLQAIIKGLSGPGNINIFNPIQNNQTNFTQNNFNQEKVLDLIQETLKSEGGDKVKYVESKYDIKSLPEVVASKQDYDASKEGLKILKKENNIITDNYKAHLKEFDGDYHEIRREIEEQIDPEADDPEFEDYELDI
jgi:hypothetical protein